MFVLLGRYTQNAYWWATTGCYHKMAILNGVLEYFSCGVSLVRCRVPCSVSGLTFFGGLFGVNG